MEWYSKCARQAFEQVVAGGSSTTAHLTRPSGYLRPEPCASVAALDNPDSFSIVEIASQCADNLFSAPAVANKFDDDPNQSKCGRPKGLVFVERAAANYLSGDKSVLQEWFDRFLIEVGEKSGEYKDRGLSLAAEYKYELDEYLEAKKTELSNTIRSELKIARELSYQWANEMITDAKLKAHDAKERALVSAANYTTQVQAYASEKSDEFVARLKEDLSHRQEIAQEWAQELAVVAKDKSIDASHHAYVLAEAFVILVQQKSIEAVYRGYILAGACRDNVVIFVEEKGTELADKVRKELRNTAKLVEESANDLMKSARVRVGGKLSLKEFDETDKKRPSADKRAIEKAEELQAELSRSAEIAQKWAEDLAKEALRLSDKIKKEDLLAKSENEFKKAVSDMKDSSAQLNDEARRKAAEAEERAKKLYDQFQKEMQASADQAQKWAAELAAAASKQADITDKRGKELVENLRKELELSNARRKEFSETANSLVNEKKKEIRDWSEHSSSCKAKTQAAIEDAERHLKEAEKQAALLAEDAKQTAAALAKLARDYSEEAKKKTPQLKERAKEIATQLKAAQEQIEIIQKELKDLARSNK